MTLDALVQALEDNPDLEPCTETAMRFVDGPDFFEAFLKVNGISPIGRFKTRLYKKEGDLLRLIHQRKEFFREYVQSRYLTLDDIKQNKPLSYAMGLKKITPRSIARACVQHGILSAEMPDDHPISLSSTHPSWYVMKDVVGEEHVMKNVRRYVQSTYKTLDDIKQKSILASVLGVENITLDIARACVEQGFLSVEMPDNYEVARQGRSSLYINKDIVGEEQAEKNRTKALRKVKEYIQSRFKTLDDLKATEIEKINSVATAFGVDCSMVGIARACVERGFLSAELPDNYEVTRRGHCSRYFDKDIVGEEHAKSNLKKYIQARYKTLDDLPNTKKLASALGVKKAPFDIARACVEQGFLSAELPDNHSIHRGSGGTRFYTDEGVVGKEQAMRNLRKYVQSTYSILEAVTADMILARDLGLKRIWSKRQLRHRIAELGWLDSRKFRSYAESHLPEQFRKNKEKKPRKRLRKIGARAYSKLPHSTTLVKGEAFEQLFGMFLAYTAKDDLVIPQYCLYVQKTYFKKRVDFKVGNIVYEVKWGGAPEDIEETYAKHARLMRRKQNQGLQYCLVRLVDDKQIDVPHEMFGPLLEQRISDPNVKDKFNALVDLLKASAEKKSDVQEIAFLMYLRDFLYNKIDEANKKTGGARQQLIRKTLDKIAALAGDREKLDQYMVENTKRVFASLEAHFKYKGKLYRGFIDIPRLEEEQPQRYGTIYYFGDAEFASELDRNIAVLLECSPYVKRIETTLENPKQLQVQPVFRISRRRAVSTREHPDAVQVGSLKEVKDMMRISDEMYDFALEYIQESGLKC